MHRTPVSQGGKGVKAAAADCGRRRIGRMGIVLSMLAGATPSALRPQAPPAVPCDLLHRIGPGDTLMCWRAMTPACVAP